MVGLGLGAAAVAPFAAMAGPFTRADFEKLVPADKRLQPAWVKSLFDRGAPTVYREADLDKIGMPVGGLCSGQLYLGGDGRLWHWDIFNRHLGTGAEHYAKPMPAVSPIDQGFAVRVTAAGMTQDRRLDRTGFRDVAFEGQYPLATIRYRDADCPVRVTLEAFSPFIPLDVEGSSLPATVMRFTVHNDSSAAAQVDLVGWLENAVCLHSRQNRDGLHRNRLVRQADLLFLEGSAEPLPEPAAPARPDIIFDQFERNTYSPWTTTGTAFGNGPIDASRMPEYQGNVGGQGQRVVNSHASAPGGDVGTRDDAKGTLASPPFTLERHYLTCLIGGGNHAGRTCLNLVVDGQVVLSATGANDNRMKPLSWDVRRWAGQTARLEVVDNQAGGWGNIGIDDIVFSDRPRAPLGPLALEGDFGTMGLALLEPQPTDTAMTALPGDGAWSQLFGSTSDSAQAPAVRPFAQKLTGALARRLDLPAGGSAAVTFVVTWHFPNLRMDRLPPGRHYATRFASALEVAKYLAQHFEHLSAQTRLWHDTWYDSTLPWWFLDRTFLNTSILATSTCYRFANGRFYGWEGVGCCAGTCGHVWQYAHAVARLFPELERSTRALVDFGLAQQPDGAIFFRGEFNDIPAIDAQAGCVLRALREHQMAPDDTFLKAHWPAIQRALEWLIAKDANADGLIESNQHNTLDTDWYGPVAWLSGLYLAALRAGEAMARELGDDTFARRCLTLFETGQRNLVAQLFEDGYFINRPDPKHPEAINSGTGCHIDQVMGQSWAFQVGLPRVLPERETRSALEALWRYNFTPDVGPYREVYQPGRWYAMPGEAGLLMCSFPRKDWDYAQAKGKGPDWAAGYFNECMNGFEYQVAGHMLWEGLLLEGLAITRAVHDRYHASRRNPWNEVECGDHYARSMASYGVFLAACGFRYHGPKGHLGFAPRLTPEDFKAAFTAAEGWGTFRQRIAEGRHQAEVELTYGRLRLTRLSLESPTAGATGTATVMLDGKPLAATTQREGKTVHVSLGDRVEIAAGQRLAVVL